MQKEVKIILTSQEYFDAVNFDGIELKEKVAYLLFYVTEVAQLRKDMVPKIIADRIADQYKLYCKRVPLKEGDVIIPITTMTVTAWMRSRLISPPAKKEVIFF